MAEPSRYDAQGFRRLPFGVELRLPDGRTFQAHGDHDAAIKALLVELKRVSDV